MMVWRDVTWRDGERLFRQQEELEEIDQIMEGLIEEDDDADDLGAEKEENGKPFSPSQPMLLS